MGSFQSGLNSNPVITGLKLFHDYLAISARGELEFQFKPGGEISAGAETIKSRNGSIPLLRII